MSAHLRPDLQVIADLIPSNSKVLDLGCEEGHLLSYLVHEKHVDGRGIELSQKKASKAVQQGLSVIQGDVDADLAIYPDKCFDYVISSQVLQATHKPKEVLIQMLRIAKNCVVSIPNFGYWRNRLYLLLEGKMPVTKSLSYEWYETPNIHFSTVDDFKKLCAELDITIDNAIYLDVHLKKLARCYKMLPVNVISEKAIFVLSE